MNKTVVRTLSGIVLVILVIGTLYLGSIPFGALSLLLILLMSKEFISISNSSRNRISIWLTLLFSTAIYTLLFLYNSGDLGSQFLWILIPIALSIPLSLLFTKERGGDRCYLLVTPLYIALPFSLTTFLLFSPTGHYQPNLMLSLFILLWSADVGGYIFGMTLGQRYNHKLYPAVSPNKSWEGFIGGGVMTIVAAIILLKIELLPLPMLEGIIMAIILFLFSVVGDLTESLFKRKFEVKDSGNIIPGHGGVLDRFDGALFAFPMVVAYLRLLQLI